MSAFFLFIEIASYLFAVYLFVTKKELAIIYIPVLIFSNIIIDAVFSASIYYATISILILSCILKNGSFYRNNIYAVLSFIYILILLPRSSDLEFIRPSVFSVLWLFATIPLILSVYQKYPREVIFREVTNAGFIIICLFVVNVLISTKMGFSPNQMYGITTGVLYGNLYGAGFNILGIAMFVSVLKFLDRKKPIYLLVIIVALAFLVLSVRRSVILISGLGVAIAFITLLTQKEARKFIFLGSLVALVGYIIYSNTSLMGEFEERYELRKLDERELGEEKRFIEYELIYKDMFEYKDYSPLYGYELFNSSGHYGKGVFEFRTLHADLPSIAHSTGILGLLLYLLMVKTAFIRSFKASESIRDKLIIFFCAVAFITFTVTGRYTETGSMILIYLILMLPFAKNNLEDDPPALNNA